MVQTRFKAVYVLNVSPAMSNLFEFFFYWNWIVTVYLFKDESQNKKWRESLCADGGALNPETAVQRTYRRDASLQEHMKFCQDRDGGDSACPLCGYSTPYRAHMERHLTLHSQVLTSDTCITNHTHTETQHAHDCTSLPELHVWARSGEQKVQVQSVWKGL